MMGNSGKISMDAVIQSTYDMGKPSRSFFKSLLYNARVDYIRSLIMQVHLGKEVKVDSSPRMQTL